MDCTVDRGVDRIHLAFTSHSPPIHLPEYSLYSVEFHLCPTTHQLQVELTDRRGGGGGGGGGGCGVSAPPVLRHTVYYRYIALDGPAGGVDGPRATGRTYGIR